MLLNTIRKLYMAQPKDGNMKNHNVPWMCLDECMNYLIQNLTYWTLNLILWIDWKLIKTCKKLFETTKNHDVKNTFKIHIWIGVLFV
jgi:hypothetical protein